MANRVLLGALGGGDFGLRVSRPGYDVTDSGLANEQLAFDSRWSEVSNVWMYGEATSSSSGALTISYGTTFITPPLALVWAKYQYPYNGLHNVWHMASNPDALDASNDRYRTNVLSSKTSLQIYVNTSSFVGYTGGVKLAYIVLRNVYG